MRIALATLLVFAFAAPAGSAVATKASLRVVDLTPVTVRGVQFQPGERVVVTVSSRRSRSATVIAGARGSFTARFAGFSLRECDMYRVRAVGSRGSRASLTPPPPSCGTDLQP
jgi:hypothetical protein